MMRETPHSNNQSLRSERTQEPNPTTRSNHQLSPFQRSLEKLQGLTGVRAKLFNKDEAVKEEGREQARDLIRVREDDFVEDRQLSQDLWAKMKQITSHEPIEAVVQDHDSYLLEKTGDVIFTRAQLATQLNVSEKTITRWQSKLPPQPIKIGNRIRPCYFKRDVDRFREQNPKIIERAESFSQLTDTEEQEILESAKQLSASKYLSLIHI